MKKINSWKIVIISLIFVFGLAAGGQGASLEKTTFHLNYLPSVDFTPFYVAKEMGYYREAGLEVDLSYNKGSNTVIKIISQKDKGIGLAQAMAIFISSQSLFN